MLLTVKLIFIVCLCIVVYTYAGYGVLLFVLVKVKRLFVLVPKKASKFEPNITLLIAAYNEEQVLDEKIRNSMQLDYPLEKLEIVFVTDGSNDRSCEIIEQYPEITLFHQKERKGKIAAVDRVMKLVHGEYIVFSDANTLLNQQALKMLVRHFEDPKVGVVAGEKRIFSGNWEDAAGAGEGLYWKYESKLKEWDAELYSTMGAAGELFAIRKSLYESVPTDTLIEDFYLSMQMVKKGYKIAYEPKSYAIEEPSDNTQEELKRKVRISAGGIQAVIRLKELLNPFKYGVVTFQYISHRVLRWTLAPISLPLIFVSNIFLMQTSVLYSLVFLAQCIFYLLAIVGLFMERRKIRMKMLFVPYYFCFMNYAVFLGMKNYLLGNYSVVWEKSQRRTTTTAQKSQ